MECTLTCKDFESFICSVTCLVIYFKKGWIPYFHPLHLVKYYLQVEPRHTHLTMRL